METKLSKLANQLKLTQSEIKKSEEFRKALELKVIKNRLRKEFKIAFADILEMLKEENITWQPKLQDDRYEYMGTYILFRRNKKTLAMDFSHRNSYRYEFVRYGNTYGGTMTYGAWDMDRFILWIYDNLISAK